MPCINRIRVNNVKYNFGTQQYDDFSMRMYGKNTLYDLANGGGKSVLMLLLLQNLIPNCTLAADREIIPEWRRQYDYSFPDRMEIRRCGYQGRIPLHDDRFLC